MPSEVLRHQEVQTGRQQVISKQAKNISVCVCLLEGARHSRRRKGTCSQDTRPEQDSVHLEVQDAA